MARTSLSTKEQLNKVSSQTLSVANISVPYTTIVNRAQIKDLANDLSVRFGVERISVQQIVQLNSEFGASGEPVFRAVNDTYDQIRFVGSGWATLNDSSGPRVRTLASGDYVEITFYGTGLNLLTLMDNSTNPDYRVSVDGGAEGSNIYIISSAVLFQRNYAENKILNAVSGLSLGLHTVKIRSNNGISSNGLAVYGFEILNENSTLNIRPGTVLNSGIKSNLLSASTSSYNSGFESGTLGTRGGHVLVYLKSDGTIGKAVTPTNASAAYLTSADHTNEEIVRKYNWREFGAGRSDDFSRFSTASATDMAFTLEDGTTTLVGYQVGWNSTNNNVAISGAAGSSLILTFVGTGLDVVQKDPSATIDAVTVTINGTSVGSISIGSTNARTVKICSGLPYGTHTVRLQRSVAVNAGAAFSDFIVYQPKKPTLPSGAVELSEYNIMADFVANTTAGLETSSVGILRKSNQREYSYVGSGWSLPFSSVIDRITGFTAGDGGISGSYFEYTFFGTGIELRTSVSTNRSSNITISLNGITATTTNFPTMASSAYGNASFTASTGIASLNGTTTTGAGFRISGLPLAKYTVRFTNNQTTNVLVVDCIDIITPVHFPKIKGQFISQNSLPIGSCSVGDLREKQLIDSNAGKNIAQSEWSSTNASTTSTSYVPIPQLSVTHYNTSGKLQLSCWVDWFFGTTTASGYYAFFIDGVQVSMNYGVQQDGANLVSQVFSALTFVNVSPGFHKIDVYCKVNGGTLNNAERTLSVKEI